MQQAAGCWIQEAAVGLCVSTRGNFRNVFSSDIGKPPRKLKMTDGTYLADLKV